MSAWASLVVGALIGFLAAVGRDLVQEKWSRDRRRAAVDAAAVDEAREAVRELIDAIHKYHQKLDATFPAGWECPPGHTAFVDGPEWERCAAAIGRLRWTAIGVPDDLHDLLDALFFAAGFAIAPSRQEYARQKRLELNAKAQEVEAVLAKRFRELA